MQSTKVKNYSQTRVTLNVQVIREMFPVVNHVIAASNQQMKWKSNLPKDDSVKTCKDNFAFICDPPDMWTWMCTGCDHNLIILDLLVINPESSLLFTFLSLIAVPMCNANNRQLSGHSLSPKPLLLHPLLMTPFSCSKRGLDAG